VALALAGCHSPEERRAAPLPTSGPPQTLRVALDPEVADQQIARALRAAPLTVDRRGDLRPGLCRTWRAHRGGREWIFDCAHADLIARQLGGARSGATAEGRTLTVRLDRPRRRFPYVLTTPRASPPEVLLPGAFRSVGADPEQVVVRRPGLKIVFRRMDAHDAVRAFARGQLDEAPVPQGEIRATAAHPTLSKALRVRNLLGVDAVVLPPDMPRELRRVYRVTAPRADYQQLIAERLTPPAVGILPGQTPPTAGQARAARGRIASLPVFPVRLDVADRPAWVEGAELAWADWRQLGLPIALLRRRAHGPPLLVDTNAMFVRAIAGYPHTDGLYEALGLEPGQESDTIVPLGYPVAGRLVSPRVHGWHMDATGLVDYSRVSLEPRP
jgi:hypothetical protein